MGDDHGAAGEFEPRVLQAFQRFDIKVVGRLVEQQQIAALLERQRQIQAVALAAGEHAYELLLVGAFEPEACHIGAGGHFHAADLDEVKPTGDGLPQVLVRIEARTVLVDVGDLDGVADGELA